MRLTIFGATGGTGTQLVRQALEEGHDVTAVVRDPARLDVRGHERLTVVTADLTDATAIGPAVEGADAVLSALGPRGIGPTTICADAARAIVTAMERAGVDRVVVCSAAGPFTDAGDGFVMRRVVKPLMGRMLKNVFADLREYEQEIRSSGLEWTIVRPPALISAEARGRYRSKVDLNVRGARWISRADLATFMLVLLANDSAVHHHVAVAY